MPELGEVAHATAILRKYLTGRVITAVTAKPDPLVFSNPLTSELFEKNVKDRTVVNVNRHGKYFWAQLDNNKFILLHFGMTGWIHVKGKKTHFIVMENGGDKKARERLAQLAKKDNTLKSESSTSDGVSASNNMGEEEDPDMVWPPKFDKFILKTDFGAELAFTDPRRLGRIRLLDAKTEDEIMKLEPLCKNGLDFSKEQDRWDLATFKTEVLRRKVPVKSLLLDQAVFAGVGNWIADEILYQARIHPEQYSNTLSDDDLSKLYDKLIDICTFVVRVQGNTTMFPENWLMLHRWGKRRKGEKQKTAEGYVVDHVTVGGRTSSYVPELQKLKKEANVKAKKEAEEDVKPGKDKIGPAPKKRKGPTRFSSKSTA